MFTQQLRKNSGQWDMERIVREEAAAMVQRLDQEVMENGELVLVTNEVD